MVEAHVGWGTVPAIVIGAAAVLWGQSVAQRLPWRWVPWVTWATACAWAFSLAMVDGWQRGFAGRLTARHEYLRQVPTVTDIPEAVRTFAGRILDYQPDSWITHVSGHPPGALLTFVWLDRIGLGGGAWAALLCLLVGSSAAAAIVVAVRALADENTARTGGAVRRGRADGDLDRGVRRRLLRRGGGMGYRIAGVGGSTHSALADAGRGGLGTSAGLGHLPELRLGADGVSRRCRACSPRWTGARRCARSFPRCWRRS